MKLWRGVHTVSIIEAFELGEVLYLSMELCEEGTLFNYTLKHRPSEMEALRIFA